MSVQNATKRSASDDYVPPPQRARLEASGSSVLNCQTPLTDLVSFEDPLAGFPSNNGILGNPLSCVVPKTGYLVRPIPKGPIPVEITWEEDLCYFFVSATSHDVSMPFFKEMEEFYSSLSPIELCVTEPTVGLACVARFENELPGVTRFITDVQHYRVEILKLDGPIATVLLVDSGNKEQCPISDLKRILPSYLKIPKLALCCTLRGVNDADVTDDQQDWFYNGLEGVATFHSVSSYGEFEADMNIPEIGDVATFALKTGTKAVKPNIVSLVVEPSSFERDDIMAESACVSYVLSTSEFWVQLKPYLFKRMERKRYKRSPGLVEMIVGNHCLAYYKKDKKWHRAVIQTVFAENVKVRFVDFGFSGYIPLGNSFLRPLPAVLSNYPAIAVKCCLKTNCPGDDKVQQTLFAKLDLQSVTVQFIEKLGDRIVVRLIDNYDDTDVTLKLDSSFTGNTRPMGAFGKEFKKAAETMMKSIVDYASKPEFIQSPVVDHTFVGNHHLALCPDDERWYRATVEAINGENISLRYVDYGHSGVVSLNALRSLPPRLGRSPALALTCSMADVTSVCELITDGYLCMKLLNTNGDALQTLTGLIPLRIPTAAVNATDHGRPVQNQSSSALDSSSPGSQEAAISNAAALPPASHVVTQM